MEIKNNTIYGNYKKGCENMKRAFTLMTTLSLIGLVGCQQVTPAPTPEVSVQPSETLQAYEDLFFTTEGKTIAYDGYAEYGYLVKLESVDETNPDEKVYVYQGIMNDGLGDDDGTRHFKATYTVTKDGVVETIENSDPHRNQESTTLLNSIIPSKVILKGALETGTTWTESFEYEGNTYEAQNELTVKQSDGTTTYVVETTVENIPGFVDETYRETREFEKGLGLVSFTNVEPLSRFDETYVTDYPDLEYYLFGYGRSGEIEQ